MSARNQRDGHVLALSGGVGGAKLALGLARILPPGKLTVVANTGDDFEHLGLRISPDLDTLTYALAGLDDRERGWGRAEETWTFMRALTSLGGENWFQLGDADLALHVERTWRLRTGFTLTEVTDHIRRTLGIASRLLPMSDDPVSTRVETDEGWLDFQDYFVRRRCEPVVRKVAFVGAERARAHTEMLAMLRDPALRAVVLCPSNPFVSIEPILAIMGVREMLRDCPVPVVAVSPIIGGKAVKGPTAKMFAELGLEPSARAVAERYRDFLDAYVVDEADAGMTPPEGVAIVPEKTLMLSLEDRDRVARAVLAAADAVSGKAPDGDRG